MMSAVWVLVLGLPALAAPGDLDTSFNQTGTVVTDFAPPLSARGSGVAVQKDGKLVVAAEVSGPGGSGFLVLRFIGDGQLDSTFHGVGGILIDPGTSKSEGFAVAIQRDDKIVAVGTGGFGGSQDFMVVRLLPNGTPDSGFGQRGIANADFGAIEVATAVALQKDGKIVVGGTMQTAQGSHMALARLNADGSLDTRFGTNGRVTPDFGGSEFGFSVAAQADGKILIAGSARAPGFTHFALARYQKNGRPDRSFGPGGKVTTDLAGFDQCFAIALQKDGKIVAAGAGIVPGGSDYLLARYLKNGHLDRSFGTRGKVIQDLGDEDTDGSEVVMALQRDGKIVLAGLRIASGNYNFLLARFQKNGRLDPAFGGTGFLTTDFGAVDYASAVAIQQDGRIVAVGSTIASGQQAAVARYLAR